LRPRRGGWPKPGGGEYGLDWWGRVPAMQSARAVTEYMSGKPGASLVVPVFCGSPRHRVFLCVVVNGTGPSSAPPHGPVLRESGRESGLGRGPAMGGRGGPRPACPARGPGCSPRPVRPIEGGGDWTKRSKPTTECSAVNTRAMSPPTPRKARGPLGPPPSG
jgi:hypothetical protein